MLNRLQENTSILNKSVENYCKRCNYPLRDNRCLNCEKVKAIKKESDNFQAMLLGGKKPMEVFTLEKFLATKNNKAAIEFAKAFDPTKDSWYLYGPTGSGKTHLATATIRRFYVPNEDRFIVEKASNLPREVRRGMYSKDPDGESSAIYRFIRADYLMIDDLGVGKDTEYSLTIFHEILDGRDLSMKNGMIITSNLSLDQLGNKLKDDRIPSRIAGLCKVMSLEEEIDHRMVG